MTQWITQIKDTSFSSLVVFIVIVALLLIWHYLAVQKLRHENELLQDEIDGEKKRANQVKSLFIANISHEIRTPLNAILGHAQLLTRELNINESRRHSISTILNSSEHLSELINDLLNIASIESNSMVLNSKNFDLSDMLRGLSKLFEKRCQQKGLEWTLNGDIVEPKCVHGDMGKIRQILVKLISNAVKFTDNGGIQLTLEHRQNCYKFIVNDTGIGISLRQQRNIYNAFSRQKQSQQGVGLGLVIAKNQIELMGGTLQIDSTPGNGSRFSFTLILPKAKGPVHQRTIRGRKVTQLITNSNELEHTTRVLIIDRNKQTQEVLQQMLSDVGITVTQARDGEEALRLLAPLADDQLPGLVFYDIDVPLQTDSEQLARMQSQFSNKSMQFVVLSAAGIQNQIKHYLDKGESDDFQNFISKPYRFEAIYELVHRLLGVQFEYQELSLIKHADSIDFSCCEIPHNLYSEIRQAAKDHEIAKVEKGLKKLIPHHSMGEQLNTHLAEYLRHYNMEGLIDELDKIPRH